ncbi:MAG: hypothetical protein SGPRY_008523 [Prymnesium sp.]
MAAHFSTVEISGLPRGFYKSISPFHSTLRTTRPSRVALSRAPLGSDGMEASPAEPSATLPPWWLARRDLLPTAAPHPAPLARRRILKRKDRARPDVRPCWFDTKSGQVASAKKHEASSLKTGNVNGGQQFGQQGKLATGKGKTGKRGKPVQNKYPGTPLPSDGEANRRKKEEEQESAARVKADEIAMELMLDEANVGDERGVSKKKSSDKKQKRKKDKGAKTDPGGESGIDGSPVIGSDTGRRASDDVDSARLTFGQATFGMRSKSPSPPAAADAPPVTVALQLSIGPERADEAVDVRVEASAHSIRRDEEDDTPRDTQSTAPAPATPAAMGDETWEPVVSKKDKRASRKTLAELPSATEAPRHRGVASSSASDCSASASASDTGSASSTAATFLVVSAAPMNDSAPTELQPTAAAHARPGVVASPAPALPTSASSRRGWETACKQPIAEKPCTTLSCCPSVASVAAGKSPPVAALSDDTAWSAANGTGRAFNAWAGAAPTEGMQVQSEPDWPSLDDAPRSKDVAGSAPASDASPVQTAANMTQASPAAASPRSSTSSVPAVGRLAEQKPGLTPTVPRVAAQRSAPAFSWASVAKKGIHSEKETKTPSVAAAKGYTVLSGSATHLVGRWLLRLETTNLEYKWHTDIASHKSSACNFICAKRCARTGTIYAVTGAKRGGDSRGQCASSYNATRTKAEATCMGWKRCTYGGGHRPASWLRTTSSEAK